jgi:hypothetical protein
MADTGGAESGHDDSRVLGGVITTHANTSFGKVFLAKPNHYAFVSGQSRNLAEKRQRLEVVREKGVLLLILAVPFLLLSSLNPIAILYAAAAACFNAALYLPDLIDRILVDRGKLLQGKIIRCWGQLEQPGWFDFNLEYEFSTPDGRVLKRQHSDNRVDLEGQTLPQPGTTLAILYVNDWLYRVL